MDNQLDPQALALAKAIRRTETGGHKDPYNARGASGEFGAFQFMPATYKSLAQKHLGNANVPPTVENQNKIVYSEIKKLKDQGYNPAQIASIWNSGKPDKYKAGGVGVNKYGVAYNVPQYVSKVSQNYKALIGTVQPVQQQAPEQPVEPTIEQQKQERIAQGLPVSVREDRAEPTLAGGIIREIVKQPLKAALSVARPIAGYSKGVSVDTNYLGNVGDYGTEIEKDTQQLAQKYKQGDISLGRAALGGIGAGAKQAMDLASVVPVGQVGSIAKAGIASKTAIPTLKTAARESLIRGGAIGAGYDVSGQLASGEQYKPMQTVGAAALGTALDFGLTKALPEGVEFGKKKFSQSPEYVDARMNDIVEKKMKDIFDIENSYAKTRKAMDYAKDANANARRRVAETDVLVGSVDDTGTIRTKQPGGAVDKYTQQTIEGKESVVRDLLEREGASITPQDLQKKLISAIDNDRMLQGKARTKALNDVIDEVAAYPLNENGTIPLSSVHDAKIATTKIIKDFATPVEYKTYQKSLARGLKEAIEENSSEEIRKINNELAEYYKDIRLIESLDGKKVKGGKLGKYFSQISGNIIGGIAGSAVGGPVGSAVGTIVGGEVGGRIRGNTFTKTFGKLTGGKARGSDILTKATVKSKSPKLPLGLPSGRGPSENFSPPRLPAPKQNIFEPRARVVGYSNSDGNLNQRYNSTATASKTGILKVSRETPKKSITKPVVKTEPKIVKSKTLPTKNGEVIRLVGNNKFTVKSPERIYNKGTRIVGEYNGKEYITNSFILEFSNDANLVHDFPRTPKGPDSNAIQTLINKSKDGAKDIGKPVSMGDSVGDKVFIFKDGTSVNPDYYNYFVNKYDNVKFDRNNIGAVVVSSDDKMVGLLMPYNKVVENKNIIPIENVIKPKRIISEESYKKALKNLGDTSTLNSTPIHLSKDALIVAGYHIENGVRSAAELGIELAKKGYKFTKEQLEELFNKANKSPLPKAKEVSNDVYKGEKDLTTKILKDIEGKTTVSKQYILDATNRGELKQVERDLIRSLVQGEGDTVNVSDFAKKVKAELLPLTVRNQKVTVSQAKTQLKNMGYTIEKEMDGGASILDRNGDFVEYDEMTPEAQRLIDRVFGTAETYDQIGGNKYENIALPDDIRGNVKNYKENIYESPIKTSAGSTHFSGQTDNYFGHTRIEDMADNKTRRIIEVQSDLYQKGNLEKEFKNIEDRDLSESLSPKEQERVNFLWNRNQTTLSKEERFELDKLLDKGGENMQKHINKLSQYNNPTAHFRMVREEIKKAAQDVKTKLQFPTGETAMKIEGLGTRTAFHETFMNGRRAVDPDTLKIGQEVFQAGQDDAWIITDVLEDGKFKAVPKDRLDDLMEDAGIASDTIEPNDAIAYAERHISDFDRNMETFDISGKVDTNNPIYKFYEKDLQKYLQKFDGKRVTDENGVEWIEVPIKKEYGKMPVEAFAFLPLGLTGLPQKKENKKTGLPTRK